ncbi:MAG: serine hydrolase [Gemmatimonadota bacterium]
MKVSGWRFWGMCVVVLAVVAGCDDGPAGIPPDESLDLGLPWVSTDPSAVGMSANALFVAGQTGADIARLESLIVVREGRVVYERYYRDMERDSLADVRSVTKSIVATLAGIAIESSAIDDVDDPITDYLDPTSFNLRPEHEDITVRDLLQMTSGIQWLESGGPDYNVWIQSADHENAVLDRAISNEPGTTFTYNSGAVHLLGVVLEGAVGRGLADYAQEVLFTPLGIRQVSWEDLGRGFVNGGSGIDLRPRDLARLGQLYLQQGFSGDRRIVPESWIDEVTTQRWNNLGSYGAISRLSYGYLWWMDVQRGAYLAWGYGGQFIYVVPDERLVVVATTHWPGVSQDEGSDVVTREVIALITGPVLAAVDR